MVEVAAKQTVSHHPVDSRTVKWNERKASLRLTPWAICWRRSVAN